MANAIELRITERFAFADGESFGTAGPYERLTGRVRFAVDPLAPAQAGIVDLDKAPRDTSEETGRDFAKLHVSALLFTREAPYSIPFVLSLC